ncbi:jupiter microtubule associated homolog 1 isoform X4 [Amblyraja radiata]|uniref:jupiter microtubule associated homolog 1 isoform X4 n=1 Tax=Amblyraja radiata TaxID=386614 RepID=UPI0014034B6C|nr:jupiter microtubule associated homolog 1 isoform X4 [Amblyraja radiata]
MTTTTIYQGLDSTGRSSSSRVLQPPGGGSSISFGVEENVKPVHSRPSKTASNIFGPPVDSQPAARRTNPPGGKSSGIFGAASSETADSKQRRNPPGGKTSGIFDTVKKPPNTLDIATGEGENCPGSFESESQTETRGKKEESVPSPVVSAQSEPFKPKKIPPGGVSSLVLG